MSRLQELIAELCPDGVEYKPLGEVGEFMRGSSFQKRDFVDDGTPCIHYGQIHTRFNIATDKVVSYLDDGFAEKMKRAKPGDLIIATTSEDDDAVGKAVAWLGDSDVVVSNDAYIYRHELDPKYMAYIFASDLFQEPKRQYITGTKVRRLNDKGMSKIVVPVPPIEVQREVVRILDEYTAAHDELVGQLENEKEYIAKEGNTSSDILWMRAEANANGLVPLGDLCDEIITPIRAKPAVFEGSIPWCKLEDVVGRSIGESLSGKCVSEEIVTAMRLKPVPKGTLLCSCSATLGVYAIAQCKLVTNQRFIGLVLNDAVSTDYVLHYLRRVTPQLSQSATGSTNAYISRKKFENVLVPILPMQYQINLVRALADVEDSLGQMTEVIDSEIALRYIQLNTFRNQLLSFPEKEA